MAGIASNGTFYTKKVLFCTVMEHDIKKMNIAPFMYFFSSYCANFALFLSLIYDINLIYLL